MKNLFTQHPLRYWSQHREFYTIYCSDFKGLNYTVKDIPLGSNVNLILLYGITILSNN